MTKNTQISVLRRMTRGLADAAAENPLTSSRAVRLALTKAANDSVGLVLSVTDVSEDIDTLDAMLDGLEDGQMLVGLHRDDALVGLIALDMQLRAAVLEMETMGVLVQAPVDDRAPTHTDMRMCAPLMTQFLDAFPQAVRGTDFEGWGDGVSFADRIDSTRIAGLRLDDCAYRAVRMTVQLGSADRKGLLLMALPMAEVSQDVALPDAPAVDWGKQFADVVQDVPTSLTAILHRFSIPLCEARKLEAGTVLPLLGCSVSSVRLVAPDGEDILQAKLGQSSGMRAVRIEPAELPQMQDLAPAMADGRLPDATGMPDMLMEAAPEPALDIAADDTSFDIEDPTTLEDPSETDGDFSADALV